ncbi:hypothetical protein ACA910_010568 [Epithemia clementina (nom. ined.)]
MRLAPPVIAGEQRQQEIYKSMPPQQENTISNRSNENGDPIIESAHTTLADRLSAFNQSIQRSKAEVEKKSKTPLFVVRNGLLVDSYSSPNEGSKKERVQKNVVKDAGLDAKLSDNNEQQQQQQQQQQPEQENEKGSDMKDLKHSSDPPSSLAPSHSVEKSRPDPPSSVKTNSAAETQDNNNAKQLTEEDNARSWAIYNKGEGDDGNDNNGDDDDSSSDSEADTDTKDTLSRSWSAGIENPTKQKEPGADCAIASNEMDNVVVEPPSSLLRYEDNKTRKSKKASKKSSKKTKGNEDSQRGESRSRSRTREEEPQSKKGSSIKGSSSKKRSSSLSRKESSSEHRQSSSGKARSSSMPPKPRDAGEGESGNIKKQVSFFDKLSYFVYEAAFEPPKKKGQDSSKDKDNSKSSATTNSKESDGSNGDESKAKAKAKSNSDTRGSSTKTKKDAPANHPSAESSSKEKRSKESKAPFPKSDTSIATPNNENAAARGTQSQQSSTTNADSASPETGKSTPTPQATQSSKPPKPQAGPPPKPLQLKSLLGDIDNEAFEDEFDVANSKNQKPDEEMGSLLAPSSSDSTTKTPSLSKIKDPSLRAMIQDVDSDMKDAREKMMMAKQHQTSRFVKVYPIAVPVLMLVAFLFGAFVVPFMG